MSHLVSQSFVIWGFQKVRESKLCYYYEEVAIKYHILTYVNQSEDVKEGPRKKTNTNLIRESLESSSSYSTITINTRIKQKIKSGRSGYITIWFLNNRHSSTSTWQQVNLVSGFWPSWFLLPMPKVRFFLLKINIKS